MYGLGNGVKQDYVEADKWLLKAAEQGNANAQVALAGCYRQGLGVPVDKAEALKWYTSAAEQGSPEGQLDLGSLYYEDAATAPFFYPVAVKWYQKAADQGNAQAQYNLGYAYWKGTGVSQNSSEAARWYQKAADQDYPEALYSLGALYFNGDGVPKDHSVTLKLYLDAAKHGLVPAEFGIGNLYLNGDGVPKDEIEALAWLDIAAATGDQQSIDLRHWLEEKVGEQYTIEAEQRSKELLKQVNPGAQGNSEVTQPPSPKVQNNLSNNEPDGYGSGVFVTADGLVLTAAHVIKNAAVVKVRTQEGLKTAQVLSVDVADDVALLKCEGQFSPVPVKNSAGIKLGQSVFTIGFPDPLLQGFSPKMTRGEISSLMGIEDDPHDWQISVPVQPGNSGGPLFDESGNAVGLVVAKLKSDAANDAVGAVPENVNYAVKSSYALSLLSSYSTGLLPEFSPPKIPEKMEDVVARVQNSVVLILVYSSSDASISSGQPSPGQKSAPVSHSYRDSSGREYLVSDADYMRLLPIKQALDMKSKQLDEMQAQLDIQGNKLDAAKAALDNTDPQSVADFNAHVDSYNSYKAHVSQQTDEYNASVDSFNTELQRVGQLVK
jgi:TPR repeat protein/V8-like Glu-specific endopeptidase